MLRQVIEQREGLRRQRDRGLATVEVAADRIEAELAETSGRGRLSSVELAQGARPILARAAFTESLPDSHAAMTSCGAPARIVLKEMHSMSTRSCPGRSRWSSWPSSWPAPRRLAPRTPRAPEHKHYEKPADAAPRRRRACRSRRGCRTWASHTFPVSHEVERAQLFMNQGLNLTFGFNHAEAARAFAEAARLDPALAMAYWGQALVLGPNINAPMDAGRRTEGARPGAEGRRVEGDRDAARARLHRRARHALHRARPKTAPRPTAPSPTAMRGSSTPFPTNSTRGRSTPKR